MYCSFIFLFFSFDNPFFQNGNQSDWCFSAGESAALSTRVSQAAVFCSPAHSFSEALPKRDNAFLLAVVVVVARLL